MSNVPRVERIEKRWIGVKYSCFYCLSLFGINHEKFAGEEALLYHIIKYSTTIIISDPLIQIIICSSS